MILFGTNCLGPFVRSWVGVPLIKAAGILCLIRLGDGMRRMCAVSYSLLDIVNYLGECLVGCERT
jgi:hypothetical protein